MQTGRLTKSIRFNMNDIQNEKVNVVLLLSGEAVASFATLSAGARWLSPNPRHELSSRLFPRKQVYLTTGGVAKRYGGSECQANARMGRLRKLNKVRIQVTGSGKHDKGDKMYNLPNLDDGILTA